MRTAFNEQFWLPDRGWYAIALDGDKRPVDACASNMGHCLWSGIVDEDKAPQVAEHLMSPEMFTGWGIRTLSSAMGAYDPVSYHNGSVWPHDNAIVVAGLVRYGFVEEAQRVADALLEAAEAFGGRLPELFCGFDRAEYPEPVPYPTSCSPQAWAAATPIGLVRSLLRLEPRMPSAACTSTRCSPTEYLPLRVQGLRLGDDRVDLEVTSDRRGGRPGVGRGGGRPAGPTLRLSEEVAVPTAQRWDCHPPNGTARRPGHSQRAAPAPLSVSRVTGRSCRKSSLTLTNCASRLIRWSRAQITQSRICLRERDPRCQAETTVSWQSQMAPALSPGASS